MSGNRFGDIFSVSTFGESHGPAMGALIEGCPAGLEWRADLLTAFLERRRPGRSAIVSSRNEADVPEVLSGVFEGKTLGTPIAILVRNLDARSNDYAVESLRQRSGHATDLWQKKFGHSDPRGSGRASGRETISRVMGGAVARMLAESLYPNVRLVVFTSSIGPIEISNGEIQTVAEKWIHASWSVDQFSSRLPDREKNQQVEALLERAKATGESYGGVVSIYISGLPLGLGQPVFAKLKSDFAAAIMSIGATMGVNIGDGFAVGQKSGSEFHSATQDYGGIRGGISTGEPISLQVVLKPTSSVGAFATSGRHDPCIVPRAIPVVEAMLWLVLADQMLKSRLDRL